MASNTSSSILLRVAIAQDAAPIAKLGSHVFTKTFGHSVSSDELQAYLTEHYSTTAIVADISNPSKNMIVATEAETDKIIGFATLTRGSKEPCIEHLQDTVELQRIYVDMGQHGKGVGKLLEKKVEDMAREQGFKYIWLGVWEENYKAISVYEKLGYEKVGDHDFTIGDVVQRDLIMFKKV